MEFFDEVEKEEPIDIWLKQRNARKYYTDVQGLPVNLDKKKIMKYWRHSFHCSVAEIKDKNNEKIIRLQGDKRDEVYKFLTEENITSKESIKIHGF